MAAETGSGRSRRAFLGTVGTTAALALAGCTQQTDSGAESLSGDISMSGSSTVFPLAVEMKNRFEDEHDDVSVSVSPTGTGGGFQNNFCPGNTDFNNGSRPITDAEQQLCSDNGVEPVELRLATDALTVIVNNDADWLDCITVDELATIWSADEKPELWSDVNDDWPDEPFNLFGPSSASGTFDYFHEAVVGKETGMRRDYQSTEQDRTIVRGVERNEYAMGYMGFAYYSENTDAVKALGVDDGSGCVSPALETAKSGEYEPLSRPLFTYVAKSSLSDPVVAEFARFIVENSTSDDIVADAVGYVPSTEDTKATMMDRLEAAIDEAGNAG